MSGGVAAPPAPPAARELHLDVVTLKSRPLSRCVTKYIAFKMLGPLQVNKQTRSDMRAHKS